MISYGKQTIDQADIDAVVEVLKGDWLTQGPAVERFENDLKQYFGAKYACAVSSGTAALHLTGLALGWQPGDIVITTPITFLATANCIVYAGATPDFADIDPITYTIDPNQVEEKIKAYRTNGRRVKAIIGVDYAGHPCNWDALRYIADKYELQLVNDNCHAMGASLISDKQYGVKYADVVIQSYHPVKHITTGEGGAILTNDAFIDEKVRRLKNHGMTKDSNHLKENDEPWYYKMQEVGYNYRITGFQCALGSSQLKKLDQFVERRRNIAKRYDKTFFGNEKLKTPQVQSIVKHAYHLYPLQINFGKTGFSKIQFFNNMKNEGVNLQVHYIPVHLQPYYRNKFGYKAEDFPVAEDYYDNSLSLPIYPSLTDENQDYVMGLIRHYFETD